MKYINKVLIEHFAFGLTIPFSILWMLDRGLSLAEVGLIHSVIFFSTFLLEIPTGMIADKFGRKTSLLLGTLLHTCGLGILAFSEAFWLFAVSAFLTGAAWALLSGAEETYVHDTIAPQNGLKYKKFFARVTLADEGSTIVGMLVGSAIVAWISLQSVFILASIFMLLALIYILIALPPDNRNVEAAEVIKDNPLSLATIFKGFGPYIPIFILLAIFFESARILWQPGLIGLGWSVSQMGVLFASLKLFSLLGSFIAEHIDFPHATTVVVTGLIGGVALLGLATGNMWLGFVGLAGFFLVENILRVNQSALLLELAPNKKNSATFLSGASLVRNLFSSILSPVLGWGASLSIGGVLVLLLLFKIFSAVIFRSFITKNKLIASIR
jgi:MFS family permease